MTDLGSVLRRAFVRSVLLVPLLVAAVASPGWAAPVFSASTPAPGSTIALASTQVAVPVADTVALSSTPTMTIDGNAVSCWIEYYDTGGTWYDDGCESWYEPAYDYTRGTIRANATGLTNGPHTVAVRETNSAGASQTCSWSFNISAAPLLSSPTPAGGAWVANLRPTLTASVAANAPVASCSLTIDGIATSASYDAATKKISGIPLANLADGLTHTAVAKVTDTFGLSGTLTWTFGTSTTGPAISGNAPADGSLLGAATAQIAFAAADPSSFNAVSLKLDGAAVAVGWSYVDLGGEWYDDGCEGYYVANYDYTRMTANYNATGLKDGTHTVVAQVTGRTGLTSTSSWSFRVSTSPVIDSATPANGAYAITLQPTVGARIVDNGTIAATSMQVDGVTVAATFNATTKILSYVPSAPLSDNASHTVLVTATDDAGNTGQLQWSFRTKSSAPTFSGALPAPGSGTGAYRPAISVSVTDGVRLSTTPSMSVDGVKVTSSIAYVDAGGTWYEDDYDSWYEPTYDYSRGTISYTPAADLSNGTHTVTVELANALGVKGSYTWTFTVTAPPVLSAPVPANGSSVASLSPAISIALKSNAGVASAVALLDGAPAPTVWDATAKVVRVVPLGTLIDNSSHTVALTVTDAAGQTASYAWGFNTDVTGPTVGTVAPSAGATLSVSGVRIAVDAYDASGMGSAHTMTVDGVAVPAGWAYVELGGYWVGSGCDAEYIAEYDSTRGTFAYYASNLSDGQHTVTAVMKNASGLPTTKTWTFTVAVPPQVTAPSPVNNAAVPTLTPVITARVTDNGALAETRITLDGSTLASTYDPVSKTVSGRPATPLADETAHTVVVTATDAVGATSSLTWSFRTHTAAPSLSGSAPTTSTTVWDPTIEIHGDDAAGIKAATMRVDGTVVPASLEFVDLGGSWYDDGCESWYEPAYDYTRATVRYKAPKLADGTHAVTVDITGNSGIMTSRSWSFEVKAPPKLTDPKPNAESKLSTQTPAISVAVAENSGIAVVAATIDGTTVPSEYDAATGRINVLPGKLLANDVDHDVTVRVTDSAGNSADITWKFHIQIFMSMASSMGCGDCHTSVGHATSNCTPCHGSDCSGSGCHGGGHGTLYFGPTECAGCHPANGIGHGDVTDAHDTSRDMASCRPCHVQSLTTEHGRRADASGASMTCASCHESTDAKVTAAVAAGTSDCAACHDMGTPTGAGHLEQHAEVSLTVECRTCHEANIVTEHLSNTKTQKTALTCDTCHASTDVSVTSAITGGDTDCGACHDTTHGDLAVVHTPTDVQSLSCGGTGCHSTGDALTMHAARPEGECAVCHANPAKGDLTAGKTTAACNGCHTTSGVDYHLNMAVHITSASTYETCGRCHHAWGSNPIRGHDVTRHATGCRTCHNATIDTASLTTECGSCHKVEGTDYHAQTTAVHTASAPASLECARCHETTNVQQVHTDVGCDACHATYACGECHSMHMGVSSGGLLAGVECGRCHATAGTDYHRSFEASHTYSGMDAGCQSVGCHSSNLATAHASVVGTGSKNPQYPDTCALCHLNEDPSRIPATATADCAGCHTLHGDMATIHAARGLPTEVSLFAGGTHGSIETFPVDCGLCHEVANVAVVHGNQCSTCHPSPRDTFTTWTGTCQQVGCHVTYHDAANAGHASVYDGCGCHDDSSYEVNASYCGRCHTLIDHQAPRTTSDVKTSYVGPATIKLSPADLPTAGGSGIAATYWVLDGGAVTQGLSVLVPQAPTGSAAHSLAFWSVDRKGNAEPTNTVSFTITSDGVAPVTTSDLRPQYCGPAAIRLTATDNGSTPPTTYYRLDGAAPIAGSLVSVAQPPSGSATHTLEYWSVDAAGNTESSRHPATFTVAVDNTPPVTTTDLRPAYKVGDRTRVTMAATDTDGSGVKQTYYSRDGVNGIAATYFFVDSATPGTKSVWYWSVDQIGNVETKHAATYLIDGAAPVTTSDAQATYPGPARIRLTANDGSGGSGVAATYMRVDGAAAVAATETTVYRAGSHTIEYWSVDAVGYEETHKTATFTVQVGETIAPVTTSDAQASYVASANIALTATDEGGSGVAATYWRLDAGGLNTGTSIALSTPGTHTIEFWSVDGAGNEESPHKTAVFRIDFPPDSGLIRFIWNNPPAGAWTYYYVYVYDSSNRLVASAYNETGCWDVFVPVSTTPYHLKAYWYDPLDPGYPMTTEGNVSVDVPGKVVLWGY